MVATTESGEVLQRRLTRWPIGALAILPGSVGVHGFVGVDVVEVAASGGDVAAGEHAGPVAQDDRFAHRGGWVVPVHRSEPGTGVSGRDAGAGADAVAVRRRWRCEWRCWGRGRGGRRPVRRGRATRAAGSGTGPRGLRRAPARSWRPSPAPVLVLGGGWPEVGGVEVEVENGVGPVPPADHTGHTGRSGAVLAPPVPAPSAGAVDPAGDCTGGEGGPVREWGSPKRSRTRWGWARSPRAWARRSPRGEVSPRRCICAARSVRVLSRSRASRVSRVAVSRVESVDQVGSRRDVTVGEPDLFTGRRGLWLVLAEGFVDQGVERTPAWDPAAGCDQGHLPVDEPDRGGGEVAGQGGHGPGLPHRDPAGADQVPQPGEPDEQLDGVRDQPVPGGVGEVQRRGQRLQGNRVLGAPVHEPVGPHHAGPVSLGGAGEDLGVQQGVVHHQLQHVGLRRPRHCPPLGHRVQQSTHHEIPRHPTGCRRGRHRCHGRLDQRAHGGHHARHHAGRARGGASREASR